MGKSKNRKKTNYQQRRRHGKHKERFSEYTSRKFVQTTLEHEQSLKHQKEFFDNIRSFEDELLSRTVYITNVRDVNNLKENNLQKLEDFMQLKYGPVEMCSKVPSYHNRGSSSTASSYLRGREKKTYYPRVRVRFCNTSDAESIFHGVPLAEYNTQQGPVSVPCPTVGMLGREKMIRIFPATRYEGILTDDDKQKLQHGSSCIKLNVAGVDIGHWVPGEYDSYLEYTELGFVPKEVISLPGEEEVTQDNDERIDVREAETEVEEKVLPLPFVVTVDEDKNSDDDSDDDFNRDNIERDRCEELAAECSLGGDFSIELDLQRRRVQIVSERNDGVVTDVPHEAASSTSTLSFRFKEIRNQIQVYVSEGEDTIDEGSHHFLVFTLKYPPTLCDVTMNGEKEHHKIRPDFGGVEGRIFGRCLSFIVKLIPGELERMFRHYKSLEKLQKAGVFRENLDIRSSQLPTIRSTLISNPGAEEQYLMFQNDLSKVHNYNAEIGFFLRGLCDNGCSWFHLHTDKANFAGLGNLSLGTVIQEQRSMWGGADAVVDILETMLSSDSLNVTKYPCRLFRHLRSQQNIEEVNRDTKTIPSYCTLVPRLLLAPCRERFIGIGVEMSNRVIRKCTDDYSFGKFSFLRVQIATEDGKQMFPEEFSNSYENRIRTALLDGIMVNGRKYSFLAFSTSQMKEISLWMVCPTAEWPVKHIRQALGDFSRCDTVSRLAARIGQCFSTTVDCAVPIIESHEPAVLHDLRASCGKFHSDGTGIISIDRMKDVLRKMPEFQSDPDRIHTDISIIQIRYGGSKGTLSAWDLDHIDEQDRLYLCENNSEIGLRRSMIKFEAAYENIEVCAVGRTNPYFLNRNIILLLLSHQVDEQIFLSMQKKMLDDLDSMICDKETAMKVLPQLWGADSRTVNQLMTMLMVGCDPGKDPFLFSCLQAIRSHHLFALRKKARVFVEKGAILMGGIDESGILEDGCVFVNVCKRQHEDNEDTHEAIIGPVMVTRHPAIHPGDVRMLLAVDEPSLRDHKNVILFSRKGPQPEADKMSGGDLDGDQFAITWDSRLFLNRWNGWENDSSRSGVTVKSLSSANVPPMDHVTSPSIESTFVPTDVSSYDEDLVDHLLMYLKNGNLGRIATLWLDYASHPEFGPRCSQCLILAQLHSVAVDFPKTGIPALLPVEIARLPFKVGHWREVKRKDSRRCDSVLGKMYDCVTQRGLQESGNILDALAGRKTDRYGIVLASFDGSVHSNLNPLQAIYRPRITMNDFHLKPEQALSMLEISRSHQWDYENDIEHLMNKYKIRSEGELFTGCIRKYHRLNKKNKRSIAEDMRKELGEVQNRHRRVFWDTIDCQFSNMDGKLGEADARLKHIERVACDTEKRPSELNEYDSRIRQYACALAASYYYVAYHFDERPDNGSVLLFSFPWIVVDVVNAACVAQVNGGRNDDDY